MSREDVQKKWEARVAACHASGEKVSRWCQANHVDRRQFYSWKKRLSGSSEVSKARKPTTFIPLPVAMEEMDQSSCLRIKLGAAVIEVDAGFNPVLLREVLKALEAVC
ncbi:IS66 family insertion sequence element accessory protein TnpA [Cohnella luojiensis]|uniref:IS66 family insertion sequence element accessory protein TnpB n=1 Tax=Cohnella luojiensis TaxID=652876 RepID=A0A4Y8LWD1_9BACL|nr:IS66 family insertion sequence element accessory protein TnpB [Cohnella luojiensis]TFE26252.1 IS66 family insertion sequence element accessory protein TnpB [Cohnella luojiensis]